MKKTVYMAPATFITQIDMQPLMQEYSIKSVGGTAGITMGDPSSDTPTAADSRRGSIWDDED